MNIYRGLQGSGKSTLAEKRAALDGGRLVGRDRIRKMIGASGLGTSSQEHEVTELQGRMIVAGLKAGQSVHVDDMNLKSKYVARLMGIAESCGAGVRILDLTDVDVNTCVVRDAVRNGNKVGEARIRDNYKRFIKGRGYPLPMPEKPEFDPRLTPPKLYVPDTSKPKAFLVDLDGTVAIKGSNRGYHDYDERVFDDTPNWPVISVVWGLIQLGWKPIYVSGRKGNTACREATSQWITKHVHVGLHLLYMRRSSDNRPDWIIKEEIFDEHIRAHFNIQLALDDRNQVVDRYREMGLPVLQVAPGNF